MAGSQISPRVPVNVSFYPADSDSPSPPLQDNQEREAICLPTRCCTKIRWCDNVELWNDVGYQKRFQTRAEWNQKFTQLCRVHVAPWHQSLWNYTLILCGKKFKKVSETFLRDYRPYWHVNVMLSPYRRSSEYSQWLFEVAIGEWVHFRHTWLWRLKEAQMVLRGSLCQENILHTITSSMLAWTLHSECLLSV